MTNVEKHAEICKYLTDLYERKNKDYGDSFHRMFVKEGMAMPRIRLGDKLSRFESLTRNPESQKVMDESIRDTLLDLANYAIMTVMEIDNDKSFNVVTSSQIKDGGVVDSELGICHCNTVRKKKGAKNNG